MIMVINASDQTPRAPHPPFPSNFRYRIVFLCFCTVAVGGVFFVLLVSLVVVTCLGQARRWFYYRITSIHRLAFAFSD